MARDFDGVNDEILIPDAAIWDALTAITVTCFVKPDSTASRGDFFTRWGQEVSQDSWNLLQGVTANRAQFFITDQFSFFDSGADTADLSTTAYTHLAGSWTSGSPVRLWRDGTNTTSSGNVTGTMPTTAVQPAIGNGVEDIDQFVDGSIAECAIWNVELDVAEIGALADGFSPLLVRPTNLLGYWPLIGRTSPEIDLINANNGTVTEAIASAHPAVLYPTQPISGFAAAGAPPAGLIIPVAMNSYRQRHQSVV